MHIHRFLLLAAATSRRPHRGPIKPGVPKLGTRGLDHVVGRRRPTVRGRDACLMFGADDGGDIVRRGPEPIEIEPRMRELAAFRGVEQQAAALAHGRGRAQPADRGVQVGHSCFFFESPLPLREGDRGRGGTGESDVADRTLP